MYMKTSMGLAQYDPIARPYRAQTACGIILENKLKRGRENGENGESVR